MMRRRSFLALAFGLCISPAARAEEPPKGISTFEVQGSVGRYRVGASLTVRDHVAFVAGHYFYASRLIDIPLTGGWEGDTLILGEPDGGVFRLELFTNVATRERPLTFYNSVGLRGTWTRNGKTLPVTLDFQTVYDGPVKQRRYETVTDDSDAAFEALVKGFLGDLLAGRRDAAARAVSYPLRVNGKRSFAIRNRKELLARWNEVFTPPLLASLREALPHEMFVHDAMAMVSDGLLWFDARGAKVVNQP